MESELTIFRGADKLRDEASRTDHAPSHLITFESQQL
jgi:hypothetical protein